MKSLLNAFLSLWKEAPLWRFCVLLGIGGMAMAAFFPTAALKRHAPWLPGTAPVPQAAAPAGNDGGSSNAPGHRAGRMPINLQYPSMSDVVRDHITLGGHTIPLPRGEWHPILSAQTSTDSPLSFLALVRTHLGAITGLFIAQTTQQPVPEAFTEGVTDRCHDDRNYVHRSMPLPHGGEDCIGAGLVLIQGADDGGRSLINLSIARLQALGVTPIPPLFLAVDWRHVAITSPGQAEAGLTSTLIPPLDPDTHQLLAPLPSWDKKGLETHPAARAFLARMDEWAQAWQTLSRLGFTNQLQGHTAPRDPVAP